MDWVRFTATKIVSKKNELPAMQKLIKQFPMIDFICDDDPTSDKAHTLMRQVYKMDSLKTLKAAIFEYIEVFYNRQRRHSGINYKTPQQAFEAMICKMAA